MDRGNCSTDHHLNFWDIKSSIYPLFRKPPLIRHIFDQECRHLLELIQTVHGSPEKMLDIGTGTGDTLHLLPDGHLKIGLDNAFNMVQKMQGNDKSWIFMQAEGSALPFHPGIFDFVSAIGVCEYVSDKSKFLNEIKRVMSADGYCLITIAPDSVINWSRNFLGSRIYTISIQKWRELLNQQGLKILAEKHSLLQSQFLLQQINL